MQTLGLAFFLFLVRKTVSFPVSFFRTAFLLLCLIVVTPSSGTPLEIRAEDGAVELAGHLDILKGNTLPTGIDEVVAGSAGAFEALPGDYIRGIGGPREVWLRFTLVGAPGVAGMWMLRVLPPYLDFVDLYAPTPEGWQVVRGGDELPVGQVLREDRTTVLPLEVAAGTPRTYYLHLRHQGIFNAYFTLYNREHWHHTIRVETAVFGLYFGIVLALLATNLLYWFALGELIYGEFSLYLAVRGAGFFVYDGFMLQWFPQYPRLAHDLLQLMITLVVATVALVLVRVFDMRRLYPRTARFCLALGGMVAASSLSIWFDAFNLAAAMIAFVMMILTGIGVLVAVDHIRRGGRLGWPLLATMVFVAVSTGLTALTVVGVHSGQFADLYGGQIASVAVFLTLHVAIAIRVADSVQARAASEKAARLAQEMAEREQAARLEQADFVAMLFHEIKTPLAEIDSAATVLEHLDDGSRRETGVRYDTIHGAVERLDLLVERSLARERQGLESVHLARQPVLPVAFVNGIVESYRGSAVGRLQVVAPAFLPALEVDPEYLRVALINLIDNALKYSHLGDGVRIEVADDGTEVCLSVRDTGPGMDAATVARAFDRYWRGSAAGGTLGAGLGLYLVRRIVAAHGGRVTVHSDPGRGSCFTLHLPRSAA